MPDYQQALQEAERLSKLSDDQLIEELGVRVEDEKLPGGKERAQAFTGDFVVDAPDQGAVDFLRKVGREWWKKLEPELMGMVCDPTNSDVQKLTGNKSIPQVAAGLATAALTAAITAPPAWVIVVATILAAKLVDTGLKALCEAWADEKKVAPKA